MVEHFAIANGFDFLPRPLRKHEGLQVYAFGETSVVLDPNRRLILAQLRRDSGVATWTPVSLGELAEREHQKRR